MSPLVCIITIPVRVSHHNPLHTVAVLPRWEKARTLQQLTCLQQRKKSSHIQDKSKTQMTTATTMRPGRLSRRARSLPLHSCKKPRPDHSLPTLCHANDTVWNAASTAKLDVLLLRSWSTVYTSPRCWIPSNSTIFGTATVSAAVAAEAAPRPAHLREDVLVVLRSPRSEVRALPAPAGRLRSHLLYLL